jgi:hypothetical protein
MTVAARILGEAERQEIIMTTQPGVVPTGPVPASPPPPVRVTPEPGTPLHELLGQREAANDRVDAINKAIANILTHQHPGVGVIDIAAARMTPLRLAWRTPRRLDTDRFRKEQAAMYDYYLKWGKAYWDLRPISS